MRFCTQSDAQVKPLVVFPWQLCFAERLKQLYLHLFLFQLQMRAMHLMQLLRCSTMLSRVVHCTGMRLVLFICDAYYQAGCATSYMSPKCEIASQYLKHTSAHCRCMYGGSFKCVCQCGKNLEISSLGY